MDIFLNFTSERLRSKNYTNLNIVLGNESCDLDSAVCALAYASYLYYQYNQIKCKLCTRVHRDEASYKDDLFVPILNVTREDFPLKSEVMYVMKKYNIDASMLIFRDDFDLKQLVNNNKSSVIIVDHHMLSSNDEFLTLYVNEVMDHRPMAKGNWAFKEDTRCTIDLVGSCATIVSDRIKNLSALLGREIDFFLAYPAITEMLHNTIILDTVNFSRQVDKGKPKDMEMVLFLETLIKPEDYATYRRETLFKLVDARKDISHMSPAQVLRKDVKVLKCVLIPSLPLLVEKFLESKNIEAALEESLIKYNCLVLLMLGMEIQDKEVKRDVAIYAPAGQKDMASKLQKTLQEKELFGLELQPPLRTAPNCILFTQTNLTMSRKQFMPLIQGYLK